MSFASRREFEVGVIDGKYGSQNIECGIKIMAMLGGVLLLYLVVKLIKVRRKPGKSVLLFISTGEDICIKTGICLLHHRK
jgi:hypothetical protein